MDPDFGKALLGVVWLREEDSLLIIGVHVLQWSESLFHQRYVYVKEMIKDDWKSINGINVLRQSGIVISWQIECIQNEALKLFGIIRQGHAPLAGG